MTKIGLLYSFKTKKTSQIAQKILKAIGKHETVDEIDVDTIDEKTFLSYDFLILGISTWFDGELPNYWDEFVPALEDMNLKGKKIAVFGVGDQIGYPENFGDAVGLLIEILDESGATIIGETSTNGYFFESSKALRDGKFLGLILDYENQANLNNSRVEQWVKTILQEFK